MKEKLEHKDLTKVVGGSAKEMAELKAAIFGNPHLKPIWDKYMAEEDDEFVATANTVSQALELGFSASQNNCPNIYDYEIPHTEVLRRLNVYPKW